MKKIKKLTAVAVGIAVTSMVFTGCSNNGTSLYNAIRKTQSMQYSETQSDISLNISVANGSAKEQQFAQTVIPVINNSKLSIASKSYKNEDNTKAQVESDIKLEAGGIPFNMGVWANVDTGSDKPVINEIIKMPEIVTSQLPEQFKGKEYMTMNYDDVAGKDSAPQIDYKKLAEFSKEFQPKFLQFVSEYIKQYNPSTNVISKVGSTYITEPTKTQHVDIYEVKLDDAKFKTLLKYTLNNLSENKDAMAMLKEYVTSVASISGSTEKENLTEAEINKAFESLENKMPEMLGELNKKLDTLKDVKIIGDKGITIQYSINDDGYIVNEKGTFEFVVNMGDLMKLNKDVTPQAQSSGNPTGTYTLDLSFNTSIQPKTYNTVSFPAIGSYNSYKYTDLLKASLGEGQQPDVK